MSFLTPLYILGALAIVAPIIFHLIRRRPQGEVPFSSLMFLAPSPPRLTRRSRLDNWLLLLLRATALALLALAFARPFLREAAGLDAAEASQSRIAILVDTSASMRRGDVWEQAKSQANRAVAESRPGDDLAILAFDSGSRTLLSFAESATLDVSRRQAIARARIEALDPTWGATDLGQALIDAVAAIEDVADARAETGRIPRRVILISDLQRGSRVEALGGFEWPSDVELELRTVSDDLPNAGLHWLSASPDSVPEDEGPSPRVRVSNDPGASGEQFTLRWSDGVGDPMDVYVPPGESRVVRMPNPPESSPGRSLRLEGDAHDFDNTIHLADNRPDEVTVVFVGGDQADDPDGLLYYFNRAFENAPRMAVQVRHENPDDPLVIETHESVPLIVLTSPTTTENVHTLDAFVRSGGVLLIVLTTPALDEALAAFTSVPVGGVEEAEVARDVMLGRIDFSHPLFAPFASAQFNDFTKIRFWKYRRLEESTLGDARVVARFENGDPALIERPLERGRVLILVSGWQPSDSQLARSSKFLPLMAGLLVEQGTNALDATDRVVGARIPLPGRVPDQPFAVLKPDGTRVELAAGATSFDEVDQPGIYTVETPDGPRSFAVNLDPSESDTIPIAVETLEQFGCRLSGGVGLADDASLRRQMRNAELEGRQKLWRWLILAAIGILIVETCLAGRYPRSGRSFAEAPSS